MRGDVGVGELGPTAHARHDDAAQRHQVQVPNNGDTLHQGGVELLQKPPPPPPAPWSPPLLCQRRGSEGSFVCSDNPALNRSSKFFATTLSSPLPQAFVAFPHPSS